MYFKQAIQIVFFQHRWPYDAIVGLSKVTVASPGENEVYKNGLLLFLKLYEHCVTLNIDVFFFFHDL